MLAGGSRERSGERRGGRGGEESREKGREGRRERERDKGRVFLGLEGRARATTFLLPFETNEFESFDRSFQRRSHEAPLLSMERKETFTQIRDNNKRMRR